MPEEVKSDNRIVRNDFELDQRQLYIKGLVFDLIVESEAKDCYACAYVVMRYPVTDAESCISLSPPEARTLAKVLTTLADENEGPLNE